MTARGARTRVGVALSVVLAQVVATIGVAAFGSGNAAAVGPVAPTPVLSASAASPIAAGAHALIDATVWNKGQTALAAPVLAVTGLPAGVSLLRVDTRLVGRSWSCTAATATCRLVGADGTTPASLGGAEAGDARIRLVATSGAAIAASVAVGLKVTAGAVHSPGCARSQRRPASP